MLAEAATGLLDVLAAGVVAFLVRLVDAVGFFLAGVFAAAFPFVFPFALLVEVGFGFVTVCLLLATETSLGGFEEAAVDAGTAAAAVAVAGFFRLRFLLGLAAGLELLMDTDCFDSRAFRVASDILSFLAGGSSISANLQNVTKSIQGLIPWTAGETALCNSATHRLPFLAPPLLLLFRLECSRRLHLLQLLPFHRSTSSVQELQLTRTNLHPQHTTPPLTSIKTSSSTFTTRSVPADYCNK